MNPIVKDSNDLTTYAQREIDNVSYRYCNRTQSVPVIEDNEVSELDEFENQLSPTKKSSFKNFQHLVPILSQRNDKGSINPRLSYFLKTKGLQCQLSTEYRERVLKAIRLEKIFTVYDTSGTTIRTELLNRGWIEKCAGNYLRHLHSLTLPTLLVYAKPGNDYYTVAISKLLDNFPTSFIWNHPKYLSNNYSNAFAYQNFIQRNRKTDFTTKTGLIGCIENIHWNTINDVSEVKVPRYHRLKHYEDRVNFLKDYRTTNCLSLLKFISDNCDNNKSQKVFHKHGQVSLGVVKFAAKWIFYEIRLLLHDDINTITSFDLNPAVDEHFDDDINGAWESFYLTVKRIINGEQRIRIKYLVQINNCLLECKNLINKAKKFWPSLSSDGYHNLWIIKPSNWCRGRGIIIKNNYDDIMRFIKHRPKIEYIVQKYIENPLLIYKTKFDIRQYMLMSITDHKCYIWMYKNCYLRFSSEEYKLSELNKSIHITNYTIQKRYKNNWQNKLPHEKMWNLHDFQQYLIETTENGNAINEIWHNKISNGMKKNIIGIVLASLEDTLLKKNSFELYGCDFMLDQNYEPILIEINRNPDLSPSTNVTAQLCPVVLEDLMKVILDYPKNHKIKTGKFELIYSVEISKLENLKNFKVALEITGKKCKNLPLKPTNDLNN